MRSNEWLAECLEEIHHTFFSDVAISNRLYVRFGRASKTRLGSIIAKPHHIHPEPVTYITITNYFRSEMVPEFVIEATLAHELVHYAHGFHSPHPQRFKHPHQGNIVRKELEQRGAYHLVEQQDAWLKAEYVSLIRNFQHG